jgi:hypothetical protein
LECGGRTPEIFSERVRKHLRCWCLFWFNDAQLRNPRTNFFIADRLPGKSWQMNPALRLNLMREAGALQSLDSFSAVLRAA